MYGVLVVLLTVMGVSSALDNGLPWNDTAVRYKNAFLHLVKREFEPITIGPDYPSTPVFNLDTLNQSYRTLLKGRGLVAQNAEKDLIFTGSSNVQIQNYPSNEHSLKSSATATVRTFRPLRYITSPIKSFINEHSIKLRRIKRKKKQRKSAIYIPDTNLKINISISEPRIITPSVKSSFVKAKAAKTNGFDCTCEQTYKETTKLKFILTPCECEADYEITEHTDICEGALEKNMNDEENRCNECASEEEEKTVAEITCEEVQTEECCKLDPMPKHADQCATTCQTSQSPEESQDDYPTYKTYPLAELRRKKKPNMICEHSKTTVENSDEPDLREIFGSLESTTSEKRIQQRKTSNKNKEKKSRIKLRRKYLKTKRKNSRYAQFKRNEVTSYKNIKSLPDLPKKSMLENILSRIKGRANTEENTLTEGVRNIRISKSTTKVSEESGCNCTSLTESTFEVSDSTKNPSSALPNDRILEEMFRKFRGEAGKESLDKWTETDSPNPEDTVTLIINVEDEVIAPPVPEKAISMTNPLSVAVEEMLAEVKSKMTEAFGTVTESTNVNETLAGVRSELTKAFRSTSISIGGKEMLPEFTTKLLEASGTTKLLDTSSITKVLETSGTTKIMETSATTTVSVAVMEMLAAATTKISEEMETGSGIITGEKLKFMREAPESTMDPILEVDLLCTHCDKFNHPLEVELNVRPVAETVSHPTASTTHLTSLSTEETTTVSESTKESTTESRLNEETTTEQETNIFDREIYSTNKSVPVIDADYDQIISRIYCNISEDHTHPTVDILKHICQDRYGAVAPSSARPDMETGKHDADYETVCFETCVTKNRHRDKSTKGQQNDVSERSNDVQTPTSEKHAETTQHTDQDSSDDVQMPTSKKLAETTHHTDQDSSDDVQTPTSKKLVETTHHTEQYSSDDVHTLTSEKHTDTSQHTEQYPSDNVQTPTSKNLAESGQNTEQYSSDDELTHMTRTSKHKVTRAMVITTSEMTTSDPQLTTSAESSKHTVVTTVPTICFAVSDFSLSEHLTRRRQTTKASRPTTRHPFYMSTTPYPQDEDTILYPLDENITPYPQDEESTPDPGDGTTKPYAPDEDTTPYPRDEKTKPHPQPRKTTPYPRDKGTTDHFRNDTMHPPPRMCDCTTQSHPASRKHRTRMHHKSTPSYHSSSPSHRDSPITGSDMDQSPDTGVEETREPYDNEIPVTIKHTKKKPKSSTTTMPRDQSPETGIEETSEQYDNEIPVTMKHTKNKTKGTTTFPGDNEIKPKKQKDKADKAQHFRLYPPLALYRTWLSPWAAIQMKQRPGQVKQLRPSNFSNSDDNVQHLMTFPRHPYPIVRAMCQSIPTTRPAIMKLPPTLGKAKGVYMGAIIVGNKYLPAGFYKLDDLKKLKKSGVPIPKIRGKKTLDRLVYDGALKTFLANNSRHHRRGKIKRKLKNGRDDSRNSWMTNLVAKLPKKNIKMKTHKRTLDSIKNTNL